MILAGSDTTTAAMIWALSLLLNHNKYLKLVQQELDMHVGRERWVEESDIKDLIYLQAVVKETLRLYPLGPLSIPRESIEDCHVAGARVVPKGTRLIVNVWNLHRDPCVWTDPWVRYGLDDDEKDEEARLFTRAMDQFMYLIGAFEFSDVIPGIEWMDLQGRVRLMKENAEVMDSFMSRWLEEHVQSRKNGLMKEEHDFMDVLLSLFQEDGVEYGHKCRNIVKGVSQFFCNNQWKTNENGKP
ncbi:hypothetical protein C3L33_04604, partial [Rhododendron williamsianum]